jgi:hypothetical protein
MVGQPGIEHRAVVTPVPADLAQPPVAALQHPLHQPRGGATIGDVGRRDHHGQQQAQRVHSQMTLATIDQLAAGHATLLATDQGGRRRLAVQDGGGRLGVPAGRRADALPQAPR